jgi:predicted nuclease of predicted toxin-antitoxin system
MKFLVDAQLPRRLVSRLREAGHSELESLFLSNLESIAAQFATFDFIEINQQAIIFHV